ncbi:histidine--tRNA ligase [Gulosibacter chungangensis]|uniref:Histidine--tRNA ligase n=1 Tax=Gulosibacter chungangensis TaxID=979746 RepID=A0A7J5BBW3_9MICO|nr:histidine--tRNA ligase [Gulosibacter chungangensis]KAB1643250.1 histidine--tRNA ligase [Gulosibacter chungangensis]
MATQINPPRGMRDFVPADKRRRERVLAKIRESYAAHGFDEIETPVVEDSDRLHSGMGGDNEKLSFAIMRRGIDQDALRDAAEQADPLALSDLGLRFDLTVPLARFMATHRGTLPSVFRSLHIGPVWRAERPQKGRYRQFVQCDIDILGEPGALAEAELLVAGSAALAGLGLDSCTIRVNDRRLLNALLDWCGFAAEQQPQALISIDKLDKIGTKGVVAELAVSDPQAAERIHQALNNWAEGIKAGIPLTTESILASLPEGLRESAEALEAAESLGEVADAVAAGGGALPLVFDPTLVRGMGYYTGTIFEVAHPESGSSVGGGGRYDGMIGRFLGQDVPACGFSIGFERIVDLVSELPGDEGEAVIVLVDKKLPVADTMRIKQALLAPHRRVRVERRPKNVRNLLDRAAAEGFTHVAQIREEQVADPASITLEPLG